MTPHTVRPELIALLEDSRVAARTLANVSTVHKNAGLAAIADAIESNIPAIVKANAIDLENGRTNDIGEGLLDRLLLDEKRLRAIASAVRQIIMLTDPVGQVVRGNDMPNGIHLAQVRVPFGVVGAIYEARPNVTVDIAAIALKSGNATVLRGGSAAENSNRVLVALMQDALASVDLPRLTVQTIDPFGRSGATELMTARGLVDVLIPRGSQSLIDSVVLESKVPVIETGAGVVHLVIDESAPLDWAVEIAHNSKVQRPSVCNALETILVLRGAAARVIPAVCERLSHSGVIIHGDESTRAYWPDAIPATDEDWATEHMSLELSIKVVESLDEALDHIRTFGTHHTDSIITNDVAHAERFLAEVDSAVVMVNASTRFTDGGEFGFGAEVGISTQKLHARGPMGLPELTSTKWLVRGSGQIRQ